MKKVLRNLCLFLILCGLSGIPMIVCAEEEPVSLELPDGEYAIDVTLEGGTGRTTVASPAVLIVKEGMAYARIQWSSSHYDYMKIGEEKYLPVNTEGDSVFEIPVTVMDQPMAVVADTTAMSTPHEIEYSLTFHSDGISAESESGVSYVYALLLLLGAAGVAAVVLMMRRRKR